MISIPSHKLLKLFTNLHGYCPETQHQVSDTPGAD